MAQPVPLEHDASMVADRALFEHFVGARARARGPIIGVNGRVIFTNTGAVPLVREGDRDRLWAWARRAIDDGDRSVHDLSLPGVELQAQCDAVLTDSQVIGAVISLGASVKIVRRVRRRGAPRHVRASFGWESLRESELGVAHLVAEGLTNRQIGARLFLSRHTVDFHLRQIFRKLGIGSRVELTRLVVEHAHAERAAVA
jgi:DNA-binding CsgD family transcriptional regulator